MNLGMVGQPYYLTQSHFIYHLLGLFMHTYMHASVHAKEHHL